ncbi:MAG: hypothetical protein H7256_01260 [Bdellovibrio sp.]|nr:hypothetical protein [Bdellovibrio sp.]
MKNKIGIAILVTATTFLFSCSNKGTSFSLPSTQDSFGQVITRNNKVDILFVIDNSTSMMQYQQRLAARVPDMISQLNSLKMDYHVAVTSTTMTTDSSRYPMTRQIVGSPKYLTSANINLLASRLIVGESGSDVERGLDALKYVTSSYAATNAPGFLRADALFTVIFLGDEDDQSSEFGASNSNDFVNYMNTFKPPFAEGGRAWIANFIGSLVNQGCDNLGGTVSIGYNYMRLVDVSGGIKSTICAADLSAAISNIQSRVVSQLTAFKLKSAPNKSTLKVYVSGRTIVEDSINGWTLVNEVNGSASNYFIQFHGVSVPAADEVVTVDFTPASAS